MFGSGDEDEPSCAFITSQMQLMHLATLHYVASRRDSQVKLEMKVIVILIILPYILRNFLYL